MPDEGYLKFLDGTIGADAINVDAVDDLDEGFKTPLPNDLDRETIFCGVWSPNARTPGRSTPVPWIPTSSWLRSPSIVPETLSLCSSPTPLLGFQSPVPASPSPGLGFQSPPTSPSQLGFQSPVPWTPASPSTPSAPLPPVDHWILNPRLIGIPIKVDISGGELDTLKKKDGVIVETVANEDGIDVICRLKTKTIYVPYQLIQSFRQRPNPAREKGLMVITRNHPEHIGKLVRRIHHFYVNEKTEENHWLLVSTVARLGINEMKGHEHLEVHPSDLEFVRETFEERRASTELFRHVRMDFTYDTVEVRPIA